LAEPCDAFSARRRCLVGARRLRRTRILRCAAHAWLAKPAKSRLSLTRTRGAAGSARPGRPAGLTLLPEETGIIVRMRNVGSLPVRKLPATSARPHRHLPVDRPCNAHLGSRHALDATEPAVAEILGANSCDATGNTCVSISVCDIYVVNINPTVEAPNAVQATPPPGMEGFEGSQRHPPDASESKSHAESHPAPKSEEANQRR
jgi:hypothetical protein